MPSIAAQPKLFIETQLILFCEGVRRSESMQPAVQGLKDAEIVQLAAHFANLPAMATQSGTADAALVKQGMEKAQTLRCGSCHMPDYRGQAQIPRLAGQREETLLPK